MIAAVASDLGIGKDGKLLFHIKEDMAWFRSHTLHNVVVMDVRHWKVFPEAGRFRSGRTLCSATRNTKIRKMSSG